MTVLVALARLVVGGMWVVSAVATLRDREGFAAALPAFGIPASVVPTAATVLPVAELGTAGLLLLPGPWAFRGWDGLAGHASGLHPGYFSQAPRR